MRLALASAVFLGSESLFELATIFYCLRFETSFRRLLPLSGSRWRYSTPPPHGFNSLLQTVLLITSQHGPHRKHRFHCYSPTVPRPLHRNRCLFIRLLHCSGCCLQSHRVATGLYATVSRTDNDSATVRFRLRCNMCICS
jgi:hypothetical protein